MAPKVSRAKKNISQRVKESSPNIAPEILKSEQNIIVSNEVNKQDDAIMEETIKSNREKPSRGRGKNTAKKAGKALDHVAIDDKALENSEANALEQPSKKVRIRKVVEKVEEVVPELKKSNDLKDTKDNPLSKGKERRTKKKEIALDVGDNKLEEKPATNGRARKDQNKTIKNNEPIPSLDSGVEASEETLSTKSKDKKVIKKNVAVTFLNDPEIDVEMDNSAEIGLQEDDKLNSTEKITLKKEIVAEDNKKKGKNYPKKNKNVSEHDDAQNTEETHEQEIPKAKGRDRKVRQPKVPEIEIMKDKRNGSNIEHSLDMKSDEKVEIPDTVKPIVRVRGRKQAVVKSDNVDEESQDSESKPKQAARGKRAAPKKPELEIAEGESQDIQEPPKKKSKGDEKKATLKNKAVTAYEELEFSNASKNSQGKPWNLKICSWNVDGIRAWLNKGGLDYIKYEKPDILCLQEVKCSQEKLPEEAASVPGYHRYWLCSEDNDGYAGVGIYTTKMAINVQYGLQDKELDSEGRIITAEYEQFYLICTYVPNAGRKLVTLPKRLKWNEVFHQYVKKLDEKKPVIICGDMNVAHNEIDLSNPKSNKKNAGFTAEERAGMTALLGDGFVDTFRHLHPEQTAAYTFWTYMMNSRAKNVGWRLDYMIVSERLLPTLCDHVIRSQVFGSDHCPIALFLHLSSVPKIPPE